ncbi:MAG: NADPH:quinone oxidoreductase family protein [Deltaproteobacteria bacterium]|nr:NADPH:quinone oxidoreductase family protein [Deltaproteobacteria bacterium]MBW2385467.1 NADPH:quinone oxidoreductase family protein [Deltaproteobacteria bacterium]MBW2696028.1 NADPH:quinone oxidoreductase family protein [Deltaproteobacteria bacterium]
MRAVVCNEFGPPENLVVEELADPTPGAGEVLVEVKASAVTFPDTLMLEDKYQFKASPPYVPGGEVAGVVSALGEGVDDLAVGDRVVGGLGVTGGFAELAVVPAAGARVLPDRVGFAESTGLNYAYGTTLYGLKYRGELQAGETLLILGAGGNVGLSAVELGKLMGARVIAAASSEEKLDLCRERGADETINYATENLKDRAKQLTGGQGCDVIYDCVGGDYAEAALRAIGWGGRFLVIGFTAGIPSIPLNLALLKSCQIVGVFYGAMTARDPGLRDSISQELIDLTASGRISPHVSGRYSLDDAGQALRALMDRKALGKVVIEP